MIHPSAYKGDNILQTPLQI